MKRLFTFLAIVFLLYIIYYDVKIGTLPSAKDEKIETIEVISQTPQTQSSPYKEVKVKAGDTLLSIVESLNEGKPISSIESVIEDFEELNPDSEAALLKIGESYKFPIYTKE
ncbi:LysM peptidoglycan-binding domain-containing protein [Bacillus sinesaloumensis]|uniref:LysM peptidoglycan-binding domain-containing protein n=1 Tax=Litchfieldia sinesaloumensis TaxID=1926280 RepID=UPI0009883B19|nr:LysM peptidoglycan-binding domain-containing protein [Bacillus sinesaloumensis]